MLEPLPDTSLAHLVSRPAFCFQAGVLLRLSTGNLAVDTLVAALIPLVMLYVMPTSRLTGHTGLDVVMLASIPPLRTLYRKYHWGMREHLLHLYNRMMNNYHVTIEFEKQVSPLVLPRSGSQSSRTRQVKQGWGGSVVTIVVLEGAAFVDLSSMCTAIIVHDSLMLGR